MDEAQARRILHEGIDDERYPGALGSIANEYVSWEPGDPVILLDGHFTPEQLEAIVWWMRNK